MRCLAIVAAAGSIMVSKKIARAAMSMTGVPVMPSGWMVPHGVLAFPAGAPKVWSQRTLPDASIAVTWFISVATMNAS